MFAIVLTDMQLEWTIAALKEYNSIGEILKEDLTQLIKYLEEIEKKGSTNET